MPENPKSEATSYPAIGSDAISAARIGSESLASLPIGSEATAQVLTPRTLNLLMTGITAEYPVSELITDDLGNPITVEAS